MRLGDLRPQKIKIDFLEKSCDLTNVDERRLIINNPISLFPMKAIDSQLKGDFCGLGWVKLTWKRFGISLIYQLPQLTVMLIAGVEVSLEKLLKFFRSEFFLKIIKYL